MSHGKPPRRPRWQPTSDLMTFVRKRVQLVTPEELREVMEPIEDAWSALRKNIATEWQWNILASAINAALAVEKKGGFKGLKGHFKNAEQALANIKNRAMQNGSWCPAACQLQIQEQEDIVAALALHDLQLSQLSRGEVIKALDYAQAEVQSTGGKVIKVTQQNLFELATS